MKVKLVKVKAFKVKAVKGTTLIDSTHILTRVSLKTDLYILRVLIYVSSMVLHSASIQSSLKLVLERNMLTKQSRCLFHILNTLLQII